MSSKHPKPGADKPHPQPHQAGAQHDKCDVTNSIEARGIVETTIPADLAKKRDAAGEKQEARDKFRLGVEVAGLIFIIIYAGLTAWLACIGQHQASIAQHQLDVAQESLLVDERPWVSVTFPGASPMDEPSIPVTIQIQNTGKTPAQNIQGDMIFTVANKDEEISVGDFSVGHPHYRIYAGLLFAGGEPLKQTFAVERYGPFGTQNVVPDDQLRQDMANGKRYLIYYGKITYSDALGINHWTQFCTGSPVPASVVDMKRCITYNQTDHNER